MIIAIVGAEEKKFTLRGKSRALTLIHRLISDPQVDEVISGECPLGGVDIWARDLTQHLGKKFTPYPPRTNNWPGFSERNMKMAKRADVTHCITVNKLPPQFKGRQFTLCYHCQRDDHVKSGGCWMMKKAKRGQLHIIAN